MMAVACTTLAALLAICLYIIMRAVNEINFLREDLLQAKDVEHTKCMGAVMAFVGDEFAAQVLTVAADDYASVDSHGDRDRIARLQYQPGGPPIPTLWLHERADRLRIMGLMERPSFQDAVEHVAGMDYNEVAL